jgi:hypothetical protein
MNSHRRSAVAIWRLGPVTSLAPSFRLSGLSETLETLAYRFDAARHAAREFPSPPDAGDRIARVAL